MLSAPTILLVEDSELSVSLYSAILERAGYSVRAVESGAAALEAVRRGPKPDLILMDIGLPGELDGIQTTRLINAEGDIPVIFLSAESSPNQFHQLDGVRAYSFIPKGSSAEVALTVIDMALRLKRESEWAHLFTKLFNHAGAELYLFRRDTLRFVRVNQAARNNLGYSEEELSRLTPLDLKPEFQLTEFQSLLRQLREGQPEVRFETLHKRKDGSLYPVRIVLQPFDYNGQEYYLAVGQDQTALRTLTEKFEERDSLLTALLHNLNEAVVISQDDRIVLWNKRAEFLFGYPAETALGQHLPQLLFPGLDLETLQRMFPSMSLDDSSSGPLREFEFTGPGGQTLYLEFSCSRLTIGQQSFHITVARDMTERKRLSDEIRQRLDEYANLANFSPVGILKCDAAGNIQYVNTAALTLLGSPGEEATKRINLLTLPKLREYGIAQELEDSILHGVPKNLELEYESVWGKHLWMQVQTAPLILDGQTHAVHIFINDITDRKKREQEILEHNQVMSLFIEGLISPAWLLDCRRRIILQNRAAAEEFHTRIGDPCWGAIQFCHRRGEALDDTTHEPSPDQHCVFCQSEVCLTRQQNVNELIEIDGVFWDVWWIPLGTEMYLHYAINVTKYKEMERRLEQLAVTDGLLGIFNRRHTAERLEEELYRARRYGNVLSVLMMDIDHFKRINDNYGHDVGDRVLITVADAIKRRLRHSDVFGRWGGEEFLLVLPETSLSNAALLAEKIRAQVAELSIPPVERVTVSLGVAGYTAGDTSESLLKRADTNLYQAKNGGRNRVCDGTQPPTEP